MFVIDHRVEADLVSSCRSTKCSRGLCGRGSDPPVVVSRRQKKKSKSAESKNLENLELQSVQRSVEDSEYTFMKFDTTKRVRTIANPSETLVCGTVTEKNHE